MSLDQPPANKMMTGAPKEKGGFHFAGDGVWQNMFIWAENIEEATKEWLKTRKLINLSAPAPTPEAQQSTGPAQEENTE